MQSNNGPYIKEKSEDILENTNSFMMQEDMLVDDSAKKVEEYERTMSKLNKKTIESYVEMEEVKEEVKQPEVEEVKKEKTSKGSVILIVSLLLLPMFIVFDFIGFNSNVLISKPLEYILLAITIILLLSSVVGFILKKGEKAFSKLFKIIFASFMVLYIFGSSSFLFILYGPYKSFRDWLIPTAMTTLHHKYLARWFYSDDLIEDVLNENVVIESKEDTDLNLITIGNLDFSKTNYASEYDKEILTKDEGNDLYKIINIKGKGYKGYLVAVYDPSRLSVVTSKYLNIQGQYVTDMAADNKAILAINGGGFVDPNYNSNGGVPQGVVIKGGKVVSNRAYSATGGLIGITNENKLVLGRMSATKALNMGVRDAVSFGPFLIVNGKRAFIKGNGGWGTAPRTAIGQRKDGIILLLVVDGRTLKYPGADMVDLTDIMENYGAYNAANLDGGTSSVMVFPKDVSEKYLNEKELKRNCNHGYCYINDPIDGGGGHETRWIATSIIVK